MTILSEPEAATWLKVCRETLRRWRERKIGPRYVRIGPKLIRYREEDLKAFLESGSLPESGRQMKAEG